MMATISTVRKPAYVYDETSDTWYLIGTSSTVFTYEYTATASQTTFTGADDNGVTLSYTPNMVNVYLNGVLLSPGDDYTATNGTSIVLASGAAVDDILIAVAFGTFDIADTYTQGEVDALIAAVGAKGAGGDQVFYENDQSVTTNYTITTNKNAVTAGPVTINSGVTVTVPSGSSWVVV